MTGATILVSVVAFFAQRWWLLLLVLLVWVLVESALSKRHARREPIPGPELNLYVDGLNRRSTQHGGLNYLTSPDYDKPVFGFPALKVTNRSATDAVNLTFSLKVRTISGRVAEMTPAHLWRMRELTSNQPSDPAPGERGEVVYIAPQNTIEPRLLFDDPFFDPDKYGGHWSDIGVIVGMTLVIRDAISGQSLSVVPDGLDPA